MTSPFRIAANRGNALRSAGPRTAPGKATSARNALRAGLFAKLVVVEAAGETAAAFEQFRAGVASDLAPGGAVEEELADRVAAILWRLRRVVRYEAAAAARTPALPPDPDGVEPDSRWIYRQKAAGAPPDPPSVRLAEVRARVRIGRRSAAVAAAAAAWLAAPAGGPVDVDAGNAVVTAASKALGWPQAGDTNPWIAVLTAAGASPPALFAFPWTGDLLAAALDGAAGAAGRDPAAFRGEVRAALAAEVTRQRDLVSDREAVERALVDRMRADRQTAGAVALYADDATVARVAKAEAHLTRELDRALAILERVRGFGPGGGGEPGPRIVRADPGFVLPADGGSAG